MSSSYISVDPLSDILSVLKPSTYVTGALSAGDPWSLQLPAHKGIKCYVVVRGECWLVVENEKPVRLREGNCLLLPHGRPFLIASNLDLPPVDARVILSKVKRYNGVLAVTPGDEFFLLGSHFDLAGDARHLLAVLPTVVLIDAEARSASAKWAVERILQEMRDPRPGGTLVAQQVASTLLIDTLRMYLEDGKAHSSGWLSALADSTMRTALAYMHGNPAHGWTLEELARSTGLSRTAFAQRFRKTVGETPIAYLTRWRLTLAAERMRGSVETISTIASFVGYQSDSAFCAAFKRHWGTSPKQYAAAEKPQT